MVLQRYRAKQELGKGSFGTVYLTEGRRDKKAYVVKVVDNLRENNLKVQEIRVMMHLRHRNIVEMCDFYTSNQQLCIVMSYADGGDLRNEVIKARNGKTTISEELITVWLIQVCQALDYAHEEHIIHRDIKPSNIFLMADGTTVKVGDFGISKVLDAAAGQNQTTTAEADGGRVGTKRYMAPEILDRKDYSNKADIWSLGCVLFELLTLNHPTYEQDRRIWFEWIPGIYSSNIREVCQQCLSENAMQRPSPKELIVKLAAPFLSAPLVQQEFYNAMQWYDTKVAENRALCEHQAELIRQIFPNYHVPVPASITNGGGENAPRNRALSVGSEKDKGISDAAVSIPSQGSSILHSSHNVSKSKSKPEAPSSSGSNSTLDLRASQSGIQKENMPPSLRASSSAIQHFDIPEYTEDEPDQKTNEEVPEIVKKLENKAQRSALVSNGGMSQPQATAQQANASEPQSSSNLKRSIVPAPLNDSAASKQEYQELTYESFPPPVGALVQSGRGTDMSQTVTQNVQDESLDSTSVAGSASQSHDLHMNQNSMPAASASYQQPPYADLYVTQNSMSNASVSYQQPPNQHADLYMSQNSMPPASYQQSLQQTNMYSSQNSMAGAPFPYHQPLQQPSIYSSQNSMPAAPYSYHQPPQQPNIYSSQNSIPAAASSYQQPLQQPNIYSSQNSMPAAPSSYQQPFHYASQPMPGSAGPQMPPHPTGLQQQPQPLSGSAGPQIQQQQAAGFQQQQLRMGASFDARNPGAGGYVDMRQSAPVLSNPNTYGMRSSFDQAALQQQNANNTGMRSSFDQISAALQQQTPMRGSLDQPNLPQQMPHPQYFVNSNTEHHQMHTQQANIRASFDEFRLQQQQQQPTQQPNIRASFDEFRLQQQQQQTTSLRSSFDNAGFQSRFPASSTLPPTVASTRATFDSTSLNRLNEETGALSLPPSMTREPEPSGYSSTKGRLTLSRAGEGDTTKVLEELERVRHGIQATLAAAVASGKMHSTAASAVSAPQQSNSTTPPPCNQSMPSSEAVAPPSPPRAISGGGPSIDAQIADALRQGRSSLAQSSSTRQLASEASVAPASKFVFAEL